MGLFSRISGGGGPKKQEEQASASPVPSAQPSVSTSGDVEPSLPSTSGAPSDLLRDISPTSSVFQAATMSMPSTSQQARLYNPYEGLSAAVGAKPHAFKLPSGPEFVFEEEAGVRRRGWTENLQFYTGLGYLLGGTVGVTTGLYQFLTTKPEITTDSLKLKTNRLLNTAGSYARPFSNGCGILGLFFSCSESYLLNTLEQHGVPEAACTTMAGFAAGALIRSPRGPRQALVAGAVGAVGGMGISALRKVFPSL